MLYKRKNSKYWYIRIEHKGKEYRRSTGVEDKRMARRIHDQFRAKVRGVTVYWSNGDSDKTDSDWAIACGRAINDPKSWLCRALSGVNKKNRDRFHIQPMSKDSFLRVALRSNGRCAVTKLPFTFEETKGTRMRNPCCASIDRIDSRYGYTEANCRFVLLSVNIAMSNWGEDVFWAIAEAAVATKLRDHAHIQVRAGTFTGAIDDRIAADKACA